MSDRVLKIVRVLKLVVAKPILETTKTCIIKHNFIRLVSKTNPHILFSQKYLQNDTYLVTNTEKNMIISFT